MRIAQDIKFMGREKELDDLQRIFAASARDACATAIIAGPPGMGKSFLAFHFATSSQARYGVVYSINSSTIKSLKAGLLALYEYLEPRFLHQNEASDLQILRTKLQEQDGEWLLIFSRCTTESQQEILDFLPSSTGHSILTMDIDINDRVAADRVASAIRAARHGDRARANRTNVNVINLLPLSRQESVNLLLADRTLPIPQSERRAAATIVDTLTGNLPLSISLVRRRALANNSGNGLLNILERWNTSQPRQLGNSVLIPTDPRDSIQLTVEQSMRLLTPPAAALFAVMCCVDTNCIQKSLFFRKQSFRWNFVCGQGPTTLITSEPFRNEAEFDNLVLDLVAVGLVTKFEIENRNTVYTVHPDIGKAARTAQRLIDCCGGALETAIGIVAESIPYYEEFAVSADDWSVGETMLPHYYVCESLARDMKECPLSLQWLRLKVAGLLFIWKGDHDAALDATATVLQNLPSPMEPRNDAEWELLVLEARVKSIYTVPESLDGNTRMAFTKAVLQKCRKQLGETHCLTTRMKCIHGWARRHSEPQESLENIQEAYSYFCRIYGPTSGVAMMAASRLCAIKVQSSDAETRTSGLEMLSSMWDALGDDGNILAGAGLESTLTIIETVASSFSSSDADYSKAELLSLRALSIYRQSPRKSHSFIAWRVYHILHTLGQRQLWDQMSSFLRKQPEIVMVSPKFTRYWTKTFQFLDDDLSSLHCIKKVTDIISAVDSLAGMWFGPNPSPKETLFDVRYKVSKLADTGDYDAALTVMLEQYLPFAKELLKSGFWSRNNDVVGLPLDLIAEVLLRAYGDNFGVLSWPGTSQLQLQFLERRSPTRDNGGFSSLNQEYIRLWNRIWSVLEKHDYGISIDSQKMFFEDDSAGPTSYLLIATYIGNSALIDLVLLRNPDVNAKNPSGKTAIFYAAKFQHFGILLQLLKASKKTPEFCFEDTTILHLLCAERIGVNSDGSQDRDRDRLAAVGEVLRLGCSPDKPDMFGKTPLDLAKKNGLSMIVERLSPQNTRPTGDSYGNRSLSLTEQGRIDDTDESETICVAEAPSSLTSSMRSSVLPTPQSPPRTDEDDIMSEDGNSDSSDGDSYERYEEESRDFFSRVDSVIRAKFWPDLECAECIISYLHSLPYQLRAAVYQLRQCPMDHGADGNGSVSRGNEMGDNSRDGGASRKRRCNDKRENMSRRNPSGGGGGGDQDGNPDTPSDSNSQQNQDRLLCPFNILDPLANNNISCAGPGWPQTRYLK
jgi:hypothetical protein